MSPGHVPGPRPKWHYRGKLLERTELLTDGFAATEASLLLSLLTASLLDQAAALITMSGQRRWSRTRFRQLLLKTAARVTLGERYITVIVDATRAHVWETFCSELNPLPCARASPLSGTGRASLIPNGGKPRVTMHHDNGSGAFAQHRPQRPTDSDTGSDVPAEHLRPEPARLMNKAGLTLTRR